MLDWEAIKRQHWLRRSSRRHTAVKTAQHLTENFLQLSLWYRFTHCIQPILKMGGFVTKAVVMVMLCESLCLGQRTHQVVDLTHEFSFQTPVFPGNPGLNISNLLTLQVANVTFVTNWYSSPEHLGTHVDAPAHFYPTKSDAASIPLSKLIGPGVVIDVTQQVSRDPDYQVSVQDLQAWEESYGVIPDGAIVLMNSGWSRKYPNRTEVFGTPDPEARDFHFPAFHPESARWLVDHRNVAAVGVDTPSLDYGQVSKGRRPVHETLLSADIPLAENLANLHLLPASGSMVFLPVYKLRGGSGGPVRAFATYDIKGASNDAAASSASWLYYGYVVAFIVINVCVTL